MLVINARNVCDAWAQGVELIQKVGVPSESRAGPVLVAPCPVTTVYARPCERVLLDPARDANPFFHLFESLWMLAGRDDAAFLNRFVKDFGERFAEPDGRIHGAYGFRWRSTFGFNQLNVVVEKLRVNSQDRQCVIQMWDCDFSDCEDMNDLRGPWRDRPCNTHIYLRVRQREKHLTVAQGGLPWTGGSTIDERVLDLTVCCRSNDIVWGAYGANAVHFSVLQEYLAGRIGVGVGKLYQVSNNWHAYVDVFEKMTGRASYSMDRSNPYVFAFENPEGRVSPSPMGVQWEHWDDDLRFFMEWTESEEPDQSPGTYPRNPWFHEVAEPMFVAHMIYKQGDHAHALEVLDLVQASDWRTAAVEWIRRRMK